MKNTKFRLWCMTVMLLVMSLPAWGQGTIDFRNWGTGWAAPWYGYGSNNSTVYFWFGSYGGSPQTLGQNLLAGTGYTAELWAGSEGANENQLQPLAQTTFRTGTTSGLFLNLISPVPVPFATPGQRVTVQVRVWDNYFGQVTTWAGALNGQFIRPVSASELFLTPPLQSSSPVTLEGMNSYCMYIDHTIPFRLPVLSMNVGGTRNYGSLITSDYPPILVVQGEPVTLAVECPLPSAQVQWSFAGVNIAHGTNRTLVLSNIQPSQAGIYTAVATTNYVNGTRVARMTNSIRVSVTGRLQLDNPRNAVLNASSNRFSATIAGVTNRYVEILTSSNLQTWTTEQQTYVGVYLGANLVTNNSFTSVVPRTNHQFYRARMVP